jgi:GNAT superfamily N-acetyltransferase
METFHRGEPQQGSSFIFRNDRWPRELVKEAPGILFVLLARDRLRWAERQPKWEQVLGQHRLGALSPKDAGRYLEAVPVPEPEVRARMAAGAKGLPFYLDLQVHTYERFRNQGLAPEPTQFGGSEPEILDRFLDHLSEEAARMLTVLADCRRFDEALWLDLGRAFRVGLPPFALNDLQSFSFVEELGSGWLSLHALMREGLRVSFGKRRLRLWRRPHQATT